MVYEMFARKRSPDSSSSEPPRKSQSRGSRASCVASPGSWWHENASRRTDHPPEDDRRPERSCTRNDLARRPSSSEARINPFSRSPPRKREEDLEPPGTGSSTLQYTLTPRMPFMTWKDRLYRELEELNCLFTVEPTLRKKANMTLEDELTYRNLAKAIICMRLDDGHLALVSSVEDPLKVMKVLADFREPELRHLERRAQQRLDSTVYHAAVPVRDFVRTFENLLKEVEKYSGERMSDNTMKQRLLSAVIGDLPDIMVGSKASSSEIHYDDLKKLLIEAVERRRVAAQNAELEQRRVATQNAELEQRRVATQNAELEQRRVASRNILATERRSAAASVASQKVPVSEKQPTDRNLEVKAQRISEVDEQRTASPNTAVSQGLVSRIGISKIVVVNDRRSTGPNASSRNAEVKEQQSTGSNAASNNAVVKEQRPIVEDQRPTVETTDGNQIAGTNARENERHAVGATVANQSSVENQRRPITSSPVDEQPHAVEDAKATEQRTSAKSLKDERPLPASDAKPNERRSVADSDADERPLSVRGAQTNERRSVTNPDTDERLLRVRDVKANERRSSAKSVLARDARMNERRPGTNSASRNADVADPRPVGTSAIVDEQRSAIKNTEANQRRLASSAAAGKNADAAERYSAAKTGGMNERSVADANAVGKSGALYERRAPRPSAPAPKDELEEQLELDGRIQELIETNPRLASKEISCTKCGAYGHIIGDCKRKDNRRKCYSCLQFVDDHVASTCPHWNDCATMSRSVQPRTGGKFTQESRESKSTPPSMKPPPVFGHSRFFADKHQFSLPPEILVDDDDEEDEDDLPLVDGLRQVYHIRRRLTTKKLKTGRTARKDLIFTDSDFYTDVEYREMFIEEDEEEPGDIILETIKVMSTNPQ